MKNIDVVKLRKKKALRKKIPLSWLKKKALLSLGSGQKSVYVRMIQKKTSLKVIYKVGCAFGKRLSPTPKKMAKSVLCAAVIYRDYGPQVFTVFLEELRENNSKT